MEGRAVRNLEASGAAPSLPDAPARSARVAAPFLYQAPLADRPHPNSPAQIDRPMPR